MPWTSAFGGASGAAAEPPLNPSPKVISVLQAGRGIAALAVVLHHAGQSTADFVGPMPDLLRMVIARGLLGVDFFFVLSGFIIYHTNMNKEPGLSWSWRYLESRLIRIFVPYLPVGVAVALAYTLLPGLSATDRPWDWVATLTLLPTPTEPALIVAWTLQHELIFYFLFWLFAMTRRPLLGAAVWSVIILVVAAAWGVQPRPWFILLALINMEFAFGMVGARMIATGTGPPSWLMLLGAALLTALFIGLGGLTEHRVLFGLAVALLLVPIVRAEQTGLFSTARSLILLGDASYAVYLVHNPLIALLARVAPPHWAVAFIWFSIAGTAAGLAYHMLFERYAIAYLRVRASRVRRRWTGELEGAT